jgi:hypothetical protein
VVETEAIMSELFVCLPEEIEGEGSALAAASPADRPLTFRSRGPEPLKRTGRIERTTSDDEVFTTRWEYPVFIGIEQHDASREQVARWAKWVLQHSNGWVQAGVWIPLVNSSDRALATIRYVQGPLQCGPVSGAVGCTGGPSGPSGTTLVRMVRKTLRTPEDPDERWKGLTHELLHAIAGANHGGIGVMHGTGKGAWPSESDIDALIAFTRGRGPTRTP